MGAGASTPDATVARLTADTKKELESLSDKAKAELLAMAAELPSGAPATVATRLPLLRRMWSKRLQPMRVKTRFS